MKPLLQNVLLTLTFTVPVLASPARAQSLDTSRIVTPAFASITTRTVVALAEDTARAASSSARAMADSLGFTIIARRPPLSQLLDQRHSAVYYVPRDLKTGYLIIVPGRRPDVVWGLVSPDSLRTRIKEYLTLNRELSPGSE